MFTLHHWHRRRVHHLRKTTELSITRLILAIAVSSIITIWSLYLSSFGLSESSVGFISAFLVILALITALVSTPILEEFHKGKIITIVIILSIAGYLLAAFTANLFIFILISALIVILNTLRQDCFDILFRDLSTKKDLNRDEGLLFSLISIGWTLGPFLAGFILERYGFGEVFILAAVVSFFSLMFFMRVKIDEKKAFSNIDRDLKKNFLGFLRNKRVKLPFFLNLGVYVWWSFIFIYMPLFIAKEMGAPAVGIFLAGINIPLIFFEYVAGRAGQVYSYRSLFVVGFGALALISFISFFSDNIMLIMGLMILASIPISFVEPLIPAFLFSRIKKNEEERLIPIYETSIDFGDLFGKFFVALFLLFLPDNFSYLVIAFLMVIFMIASFYAKEK